MKMMHRLLENTNRIWKTDPKPSKVMTVRKVETLSHHLMTITTNQMHFHSHTFREALPIKQSILTEGMSLQELADTITSLGYSVTIASGIDTSIDAKQLLPAENIDISLGGDVTIFTSPVWKILYPVARLLEDAEQDMESAIKQMYISSTRGKWLDYWASFFNVKRVVGEDDTTMARRIFMTIMNLKTNNIAIEELLRYSLKTDVYITDIEPVLFEVKVSPEYIQYAHITDELIASIKGAGIEYIYHFYKELEENYPSYLTDKTGKPAKENDSMISFLDGLVEGSYGWRLRKYSKYNEIGFILNTSELNIDSIELVYALVEGGSMKMVDSSGTTVKEMTF